MMRGWFGRTKKVPLKDEEEDNQPSGGLGGFGAVHSFAMDPVVDPRELVKEEALSPPKSPAAPKKKDLSPSDSESSSSSSSEEVEDDVSENFPDDYSVDESTIAGPLFDESAYSVNDDEYSVDTFDISAQEGKWRQKKANDFLADFYAERAAEKKKKQAEKEALIANKNKSNEEASSASKKKSASPEENIEKDEHGFPTFPSQQQFARPVPREEEQAQPVKVPDKGPIVPQRRLSTGMPRRLSAGGAPKFASIPEDGEFDHKAISSKRKAKRSLKDGSPERVETATDASFDDSFTNPFGPSEFDAGSSAGETWGAGYASSHHKQSMEGSYQTAEDSDASFGYNGSFDNGDNNNSISLVSEDGTFADYKTSASISTGGRSRRTNRSSMSRSTRNSRRASVESADTFANESTDTFANFEPTSSKREREDLEEINDEEDDEEDASNEHGVVGSESEDESQESDANDSVDEDEVIEKSESSLGVVGHLSNEFDRSADFRIAAQETKDNSESEYCEDSESSDGSYAQNEKSTSTQSPKTKKGVFSYDSDVSDPDEPSPVNHPSQLFGYLEANTQQATFEDDEGSLDSTPSKPQRSRSGEILLGKGSEHSHGSDEICPPDREVRSGGKRVDQGAGVFKFPDKLPSRPQRQISVEQGNVQSCHFYSESNTQQDIERCEAQDESDPIVIEDESSREPSFASEKDGGSVAWESIVSDHSNPEQDMHVQDSSHMCEKRTTTEGTNSSNQNPNNDTSSVDMSIDSGREDPSVSHSQDDSNSSDAFDVNEETASAGASNSSRQENQSESQIQDGLFDNSASSFDEQAASMDMSNNSGRDGPSVSQSEDDSNSSDAFDVNKEATSASVSNHSGQENQSESQIEGSLFDNSASSFDEQAASMDMSNNSGRDDPSVSQSEDDSCRSDAFDVNEEAASASVSNHSGQENQSESQIEGSLFDNSASSFDEQAACMNVSINSGREDPLVSQSEDDSCSNDSSGSNQDAASVDASIDSGREDQSEFQSQDRLMEQAVTVSHSIGHLQNYEGVEKDCSEDYSNEGYEENLFSGSTSPEHPGQDDQDVEPDERTHTDTPKDQNDNFSDETEITPFQSVDQPKGQTEGDVSENIVFSHPSGDDEDQESTEGPISDKRPFDPVQDCRSTETTNCNQKEFLDDGECHQDKNEETSYWKGELDSTSKSQTDRGTEDTPSITNGPVDHEEGEQRSRRSLSEDDGELCVEPEKGPLLPEKDHGVSELMLASRTQLDSNLEVSLDTAKLGDEEIESGDSDEFQELIYQNEASESSAFDAQNDVLSDAVYQPEIQKGISDLDDVGPKKNMNNSHDAASVSTNNENQCEDFVVQSMVPNDDASSEKSTVNFRQDVCDNDESDEQSHVDDEDDKLQLPLQMEEGSSFTTHHNCTASNLQDGGDEKGEHDEGSPWESASDEKGLYLREESESDAPPFDQANPSLGETEKLLNSKPALVLSMVSSEQSASTKKDGDDSSAAYSLATSAVADCSAALADNDKDQYFEDREDPNCDSYDITSALSSIESTGKGPVEDQADIEIVHSNDISSEHSASDYGGDEIAGVSGLRENECAISEKQDGAQIIIDKSLENAHNKDMMNTEIPISSDFANSISSCEDDHIPSTKIDDIGDQMEDGSLSYAIPIPAEEGERNKSEIPRTDQSVGSQFENICDLNTVPVLQSTIMVFGGDIDVIDAMDDSDYEADDTSSVPSEDDSNLKSSQDIEDEPDRITISASNYFESQDGGNNNTLAPSDSSQDNSEESCGRAQTASEGRDAIENMNEHFSVSDDDLPDRELDCSVIEQDNTTEEAKQTEDDSSGLDACAEKIEGPDGRSDSAFDDVDNLSDQDPGNVDNKNDHAVHIGDDSDSSYAEEEREDPDDKSNPSSVGDNETKDQEPEFSVVGDNETKDQEPESDINGHNQTGDIGSDSKTSCAEEAIEEPDDKSDSCMVGDDEDSVNENDNTLEDLGQIRNDTNAISACAEEETSESTFVDNIGDTGEDSTPSLETQSDTGTSHVYGSSCHEDIHSEDDHNPDRPGWKDSSIPQEECADAVSDGMEEENDPISGEKTDDETSHSHREDVVPVMTNVFNAENTNSMDELSQEKSKGAVEDPQTSNEVLDDAETERSDNSGRSCGEMDKTGVTVSRTEEEKIATESGKSDQIEGNATKEQSGTVEQSGKESKQKSSWGFSLFSSKREETEKDKENEVSKEEQITDKARDSVESNLSDDNAVAVANISQTNKDIALKQTSKVESPIEEAKSTASTATKTKETSKPKSSWGFSLFSGKAKGQEDKDAADGTPEANKIEKEVAAVDIPVDVNESQGESVGHAESNLAKAKQFLPESEKPVAETLKKEEAKSLEAPTKENTSRSSWGFSLFSTKSSDAGDEKKKDMTEANDEPSDAQNVEKADQATTNVPLAEEDPAKTKETLEKLEKVSTECIAEIDKPMKSEIVGSLDGAINSECGQDKEAEFGGELQSQDSVFDDTEEIEEKVDEKGCVAPSQVDESIATNNSERNEKIKGETQSDEVDSKVETDAEAKGDAASKSKGGMFGFGLFSRTLSSESSENVRNDTKMTEGSLDSTEKAEQIAGSTSSETLDKDDTADQKKESTETTDSRKKLARSDAETGKSRFGFGLFSRSLSSDETEKTVDGSNEVDPSPNNDVELRSDEQIPDDLPEKEELEADNHAQVDAATVKADSKTEEHNSEERCSKETQKDEEATKSKGGIFGLGLFSRPKSSMSTDDSKEDEDNGEECNLMAQDVADQDSYPSASEEGVAGRENSTQDEKDSILSEKEVCDVSPLSDTGVDSSLAATITNRQITSSEDEMSTSSSKEVDGYDNTRPKEKVDEENESEFTFEASGKESNAKNKDDELLGYVTDDSESSKDDMQSVSSDFRQNELSKAMRLLNGDFDDDSVMTELESKCPTTTPFSADDSSDDGGDDDSEKEQLGDEGGDDDSEKEQLGECDSVLEEKNTEMTSFTAQSKVVEDSTGKSREDVVQEDNNSNDLSDNSEESSDEDDSEDDTDSEEDDDDDEDEDEKPTKLVVKEAPLLRLENVTAQTRSKIPESRMQKKGAGWGWLFGGSEKAESKDKKEDAEIGKEKPDEAPKESEAASSSAEPDKNLEAPEPEPESTNKPPDNLPADNSPADNPAEKDSAETKPADELLPKNKKAKKAKKEKKDKKEKKEKKSKGLASHFSKTKVRTFTRHGDEVSVGTMNLKAAPTEEQQHVIISNSRNVFEDTEFSQDERPWEKDAPNRRPLKLKQSELNADIAIDEGSEGSDDSDDVAPTSATLDSLFGDDGLSVAESQEVFDALSQADGLSQADTVSLSALEMTLQKTDKPEEVNFDDMWDTMSADVSTAMEYEKKQRENFRKKKEKKSSRGGDDDMDGDDVKRLRLFEKNSEKDNKKGKKGKRSRGKKKKEKLSMEFLTAIREVFDEDDEGETEDDEDDDESSDGSRGDRNRRNRMRADDDDDQDDTRSEMSMFIGTKQYLDNKRRGGSDDFGSASEDEPSIAESEEDASYADGRRSNDEDDISEAKSRRSRRSKTSHRSKRTSKSSRSSSSKSTKTKRKPAEVLQEEIKRQQGGKLLSVSSLRQEMSDRRGTSVELLKKEFEKQKREKAAKEERREVASDPIIGRNFSGSGFGSFNTGFGSNSGGFGGNTDLFGKGFESKFADLGKPEESQKDKSGLGGHLSRWADKEGVSDLDDLRTVQQDNNAGSGENSLFGFGPPTTIIQDLPSLPGMSPGLPADLLVGGPISGTKSKKSSKKKKQNNGFDPSFDDMPMPMTTITEFDDEDDNEMGLLASSSHQVDDDDNMSYRSNRSSRSRGGRFGLSGIKAPKLKGIGKLMPSKKKNKSSGSSLSGGFFDDENDFDSGGLLG